MTPISWFNLISYLRDRGIKYSSTGKNVSSGWIGIPCFWCGDTSNHLGINIHSGKFKCFRCGEKGYITKIIQEINGVSYADALSVIEEYSKIPQKQPEPRNKNNSGGNEILPKESTEKFPEIHLRYLEKRGFDPEKIIPQFRLKACYNTGDWAFRIIIPVQMNEQIVGFTSRDVTEKALLRYKSISNQQAILPKAEWLYYSKISGDSAIIVEGPTDVWRLGDNTIATFGSGVAPAQIKNILQMNLKQVFILFDSEEFAQKLAEKLGQTLSAGIDEVRILTIAEDDPASMKQEDADALKREIFTC